MIYVRCCFCKQGFDFIGKKCPICNKSLMPADYYEKLKTGYYEGLKRNFQKPIKRSK